VSADHTGIRAVNVVYLEPVALAPIVWVRSAGNASDGTMHHSRPCADRCRVGRTDPGANADPMWFNPTMWTSIPSGAPIADPTAQSMPRGPASVQVLEKAISVLNALLEDGDEMSLADISRATSLSRTTAHRLLATLAHHRFVERTETGRFVLGLHIFMLGSAVHERSELAHLAEPYLTALAERFRLSSYLSVLDGDFALCLERVDRGGVQMAIYRRGEKLPLHLGAGPMVLLASLAEPALERILATALIKPTPLSVIDPAEIRARTVQIRLSGIAYAEGDLEVGVVAIGAPVKPASGSVVAAVSVAGLSQQITPERRPLLVEAVRETANAIADATIGPRDPSTKGVRRRS
jgi:DNA-binding IclR family transcriptional regulator